MLSSHHGSRVPDSQPEKAQILETIPVHMLSIKASPGVSVRSRDEMKTEALPEVKSVSTRTPSA